MGRLWRQLRTWQAILAAAAFVLASIAYAQTAPPAAPPPAEAAAPATADVAAAEVSDAPLVTLPLPEVGEPEVIDVPADDGKAIGVLWRWIGVPSDTATVTIQIKADQAALEALRLTEQQLAAVDAAGKQYKQQLEELQPQINEAEQALSEADALLVPALANRTPESAELRRKRWQAQARVTALHERKTKLDDWLQARAGKLLEQDRKYRYLEAALADAGSDGAWLKTNVDGAPALSLAGTKADSPERFGSKPQDADKLYQEVTAVVVPSPLTEAPGGSDQYGQTIPPSINLPLEPGTTYALRMLVADPPQEEATDLGSATARANLFLPSKLNNLLMVVGFGLIILVAIALARKNPNLFIRRIGGLEAVDEAIGRATEMGKPVFYLNGMTTLADLSTLAALNILGRVARRVAEYDSGLLVPCRDPVVMGVAQEVVRESFLDMGRPDAYRDDSVFFLTDDQFSYTASVCALMVRDKPAANFFMGYYYAESLLLAETGASTGAIQIAGTDSVSQLPFFITACDYTLIGEELYAASAYLSREPLLLGSLKGQDVGKAIIMLLILLQTLLFLVNPEWDWLRNLVKPL